MKRDWKAYFEAFCYNGQTILAEIFRTGERSSYSMLRFSNCSVTNFVKHRNFINFSQNSISNTCIFDRTHSTIIQVYTEFASSNNDKKNVLQSNDSEVTKCFFTLLISAGNLTIFIPLKGETDWWPSKLIK